MASEIEQQMVNLIATKLQTGIIHPGDPARDIPPRPVVLPFGPRPGQPKEMTDLLDKTVQLLSEAIIFTLTGEGAVELVPKTEARTLRVAAGAAAPMQVVPVHCVCDTGRQDPLAVLTFTDPERIVINGGALIAALHAREIACPHERS